jgi:hypothetical protein
MGYPILEDGSFDYDHPLPTPQRLTDEQAGYGAPSEAAVKTVECVIAWLDEPTESEWHALIELAMMFDAFAQQAVAAREAEIVAALEHQAEVWERMKDMTPSAELRASVYRAAANIVKP